MGTTLAGRYRILERLGRGGMSTVYLARHVVIDRLSAIKVLRRDLCDDPVQRDRFLREARAVNRINHENIVEITDYGESEDGRVFLVMEYLPGESLMTRMERGVIAPIEALGIAIQIAAGLARAHQMGVVHRDLKPDNVLLVASTDGTERVKILDFGIAKLLDLPALTATDKIFGTPGYIAPEYAAGAPIDGRADLYSLGVVLYEMVTGALPFDVEFQGDLLIKHLLDPPVPPRARRPELPDSINDLILRALAKDPNQRFRDAHHMIEEIARVRDQLIVEDASAERPLPASAGVPSPVFEDPDSLHSRLSPPPPRVGAGPGGAAEWARFLEAVRASAPRGAEMESVLTEMGRLCEAMRERSDRLSHLKGRMLALEARGRDFRSTIGRAIDTLASDLSHKIRERDTLAEERERQERHREHLLALAREGDRRAQAEADLVLWQIAASDELLRSAVAACEDVEYQLRELSAQLERLSEALEVDQNELVKEIHSALEDLSQYDVRLRALAKELIPGR